MMQCHIFKSILIIKIKYLWNLHTAFATLNITWILIVGWFGLSIEENFANALAFIENIFMKTNHENDNNNKWIYLKIKNVFSNILKFSEYIIRS